ncbi:glycoside hydrolase family 3 N-terminal domain-containing protein [Geodermatophilus marinus]|uniref:glycoside hydrolase family 3 N-terminal domain-containing protein n=1 Tax=Geodermatophilus sp. LHW52908 TaxID=2303986 RepID=UPI000E3E4F46|nr:glycoside hydrolase family 3 N-terminal domain-containing protein [Geodermatophilus sp. LHW52908]RFU21312.1 glycoside hydrolase family 3 protein [Geodermatophilus sp. LHW52908]
MRPARLLAPLLALALTACAGGTSAPATTATTSPAPTTPASAPTPEPDPLEQAVDAALAGLDRRAQVAQLFVVSVELTDLSPGEALIREQDVGGIFLRGRSTASTAELATLTESWVEAADGPAPWIAADQEGGAVQALSGEGFSALPPAVEQAALPPEQLAALASGLGSELAAAGVTLDLAPVVDVVPPGTERGNPPIGFYGRQYGGDPEEVVLAAGAVAWGLAEHGVVPTLKHFPGLGRLDRNPDVDPVVVDDRTTADGEQVQAFAALVDSPADPFVMMSSATYAQLDAGQAALFSPAVVTGLLRERLGFDGVVITDDVGNAAALQDVPVGERATRFLAAGGTLVLTLQPRDVPEMVDAVLARDAADPVFAARVDDAVRTALLAKARAGLLPPA